jgi:hypothetical protein
MLDLNTIIVTPFCKKGDEKKRKLESLLVTEVNLNSSRDEDE